MTLSRRTFIETLGLAGGAVVSSAFISARGSEGAPGLSADDVGAMRSAADGGPLRLDSNENPNGPGAAVVEGVQAAFGERGSMIGRYQNDRTDLVAAIAARYGTKRENVVMGTGSTELLRVATHAFTTTARPLVQGAPTYEECERYARIVQHPVKNVPVNAGLRLDLAAMTAAAQGAGLVYVCNPNNPTATVLAGADIANFAARLAQTTPSTTILVDEAYHDYVTDRSYETQIPLALERANVIVCRTFSKAHGMAGLRVAYAIGQPEGIAAMTKAKGGGTNVLNVLGYAGALQALGGGDHLNRERAANVQAREYAARWFRDAGYTLSSSETNFIFVDVRRSVETFRDACRRLGVLIGRPFPALGTHARISIGTLDEMQQACDVFRQVLRA